MFGIALCRCEYYVGVLRVYDDLVDLGRLLEADVHEGLARIDGLIHAVAVRTTDGIPGTDVNDIRIRGRDLHGPDAVDILELIEDREPRNPGTRRLPDAARGCADVVDAGLA